ncbi:nucleotidyl transferase AbiEii/AbiGii toxin family protein [bacterium]
MNGSEPNNVSLSVHQRLNNLSRERGEDPNLLLIRYAVERLLYRLSESEFAEKFILKGAMLFSVWTQIPHRTTKDLDLLGLGDLSSDDVRILFQSLCAISTIDDGLNFISESIKIEEIREPNEYNGFRIHLECYLGNVRIPVQIDVAFGDVVNPSAKFIKYPTLLNFPSPRILAYPIESVVAEKFQAIVYLGIANSRMKDYFDLYMLCQLFKFNPKRLKKAIQATFQRRHTSLPNNVPIGLSNEFSDDDLKQTQWKAFLQRNRIDNAPMELEKVLTKVREFILPVVMDV